MNRAFASLAVVLLVSPAHAAYKSYPVMTRASIVDDGGTHYETRRVPMGFSVQIVGDSGGVKPETFEKGRPFVTAENGERYSVRLYNPLPVRVAVNLTVDGLNSISGKPSGIADGEKWMIEPYGSVVIRGWQVNGGESRRFFFTDKPKSYARWEGDRAGMDLSANCGVIGAAYFWSQEELDRYYEDHPVYRYSARRWNAPESMPAARGMGALKKSAMADAAPAAGAAAQEAGTGMGERESHPTTEVEFHYDAGMYDARQAVAIYYDFAAPAPAPNPFPALSYAAEMP